LLYLVVVEYEPIEVIIYQVARNFR